MLADGTYLVRDYRMLRWLPKKCLVKAARLSILACSFGPVLIKAKLG
jgi:hypothetical protein